ncbi:MAG: ParB N-terminal domain-containing protein [Phenylobacterium sp.]|uniref:ParB/RepB/Spo0J family partition protein n=1 Tax=Phenylobacterium sp. TaxID=1871053 RepID=UPI002732E9EF|nr:ParB N-terminal domain-containing protein [Phenylobacterium sp.]MDP3748415.1 ParB N-terminal domain-containing protein [Phenylobacterium sp.]
MTDVQETPTQAAAPVRVRKTYLLRDLDVAPENMRFGTPPDEEIPQLAATIKAAGLLQPLTVRPGRRREKAAMAPDGRRRLLALGLLLAEGAVGEDYPVDVFEEIDPGRQAAAVLLTNTAVPVHVADVIAAIGKMLKAELTPAAIAAALGYGEIEVRRLAALSGLHPKALQALKLGRIALRQARLLARLPDTRLQAEIAETAIKGYGFAEHRVTEALGEGRVTAQDHRFALVGPERYAAAGGRIETDLFGERPDLLLDPEVLETLWIERATTLAGRLAREGLVVQVSSQRFPEEPADLEPFGYAHGLGLGLDADQLAGWRAAREAMTTAGRAAVEEPPGGGGRARRQDGRAR